METNAFYEYRREYLDDIHINAQIEGSLPGEYFFSSVLEKLSAMGELIDPRIKPTRKRCSNNRILAFDGYCFDESDKSFVLIVNDFKDSIDETLTKTEIETIKQRMLNFLQEAYDNKLREYFDITDEMLVIGNDVGKRMKIDYVNLENDNSIDKIKLYIVTNKILSEKITTLKSDDFLGKQVELNVWSIKRFLIYINREETKSRL